MRCWAQLVWHTCKADRESIAEGASSPFPSATLPHSSFSSVSNSTNGVMMLKVCLSRIVAAIKLLVWGSERRRSADAGTWLTPVYSVTRHSTCRRFLSKKLLLYCQFLHVPFLVDVYCAPRRRPLRRLMYVSHPRHQRFWISRLMYYTIRYSARAACRRGEENATIQGMIRWVMLRSLLIALTLFWIYSLLPLVVERLYRESWCWNSDKLVSCQSLR